jgi:Fe-S cluster assembly protein SufD
MQKSRSILLSPDARVYTRPQLEIYADDVKCSHGAAVGQLDEQAVYYMRQRGLDTATARRLQLEGFASEITSRAYCGAELIERTVLERLEKI